MDKYVVQAWGQDDAWLVCFVGKVVKLCKVKALNHYLRISQHWQILATLFKPDCQEES